MAKSSKSQIVPYAIACAALFLGGVSSYNVLRAPQPSEGKPLPSRGQPAVLPAAPTDARPAKNTEASAKEFEAAEAQRITAAYAEAAQEAERLKAAETAVNKIALEKARMEKGALDESARLAAQSEAEAEAKAIKQRKKIADEESAKRAKINAPPVVKATRSEKQQPTTPFPSITPPPEMPAPLSSTGKPLPNSSAAVFKAPLVPKTATLASEAVIAGAPPSKNNATGPSLVAAAANKVWIRLDERRTVSIEKGQVLEGYGEFLGVERGIAKFERGSLAPKSEVN